MANSNPDLYGVTSDFEDRLNLFFESLGVVPVLNRIVLVKTGDYDRLIDTTSNVSFHSLDADRKETTLAKPFSETGLRGTDYQNKILVRERGGEVDLAEVFGAVLKVYFPMVAVSDVEAQSFAVAFRCYDKLYSEPVLRDFFVELCKNDGNLLKIAQMRKQ